MERIEAINELAQKAWQTEFNIGLILLLAGWGVLLYQMIMGNRDTNIVLGFMFPSVTIPSGIAAVIASYAIPTDVQRYIAEVMNEYNLWGLVYSVVLIPLAVTAIYIVVVRIYRVYGGKRHGSIRTSSGDAEQ